MFNPSYLDPEACAQQRVRRRRLPHLEVDGGIYFVTFRLAGTLPALAGAELRPAEGVRRALEERTTGPARMPALQAPLATEGPAAQQPIAGGYPSPDLDRSLDAARHGPQFLANPRIASLVLDALRHFDGTRYDLHAAVVMPNHVHAVLWPLERGEGCWPLQELMHTVKSFTASRANRLLGRVGSFWQREYYDHLIRDETEWRQCVEYTLANPVSAGLCQMSEQWVWRHPASGYPPSPWHHDPELADPDLAGGSGHSGNRPDAGATLRPHRSE
jgi:REP element-mobilizing transposase RayT